MISKIVIASVLAASSVSGSAQEAMPASQPARSADGSTSQWPRMHQCTLDAVSNFTLTNTGGVSTGRSSIAGEISVSRIDLQVTGSPGGSPTITAHAINTKGTGQTSGRASAGGVKNQNPIGIDCVTSEVTGDEAAQKASMVSFTFTSRNAKGVGWSCSVSGSEEKPVFVVGLLVPTILGQAERDLTRASDASAGQGASAGKAASWSWGVSNNRVSIVTRSAENSDNFHVACASKEPRKANYDLALMTKA